MTTNELIGRVVVEYLLQQKVVESGNLKYCISGLSKEITSKIVEVVGSCIELQKEIEIYIPRTLATNDLNDKWITDETAVKFRNMLPQAGKRIMLFAISNEELQTSGGSVATLRKIGSNELKAMRAEWLAAANLASELQEEHEKSVFYKIISALADNNSVGKTISSFSSFILAFSQEIRKGTSCSIINAAENSSPALRVPKQSGMFSSNAGDVSSMADEIEVRAVQLKRYMYRLNDKGEPFDKELLEKNLAALISNVDSLEEYEDVIRDFIEDDLIGRVEWTATQEELVNIPWNIIEAVFDGKSKKTSSSLGELTREYFNDEHPNVLDDNEDEMLESLTGSSRVSDRIRNFYFLHRTELSQGLNIPKYRQLSVLWEKMIFKNPEVFEDFLEGLVSTVHRVIGRTTETPPDPIFQVTLPGSERKGFWERDHNFLLSKYFRFRNRGIEKLFDNTVSFRFGRMFSDPENLIEHKDVNFSKAKKFREFKFEVSLISKEGAGNEDTNLVTPTAQFIWTMDPKSIPLSLPDDIAALILPNTNMVGLYGAPIDRNPISSKGEIQEIKFKDRDTIRDAFSGSNGKFVNPNIDDCEISEKVISVLEDLCSGQVISLQQKNTILASFEDFLNCYSIAIKGWVDPDGLGISSDILYQQAEKYGHLIKSLIDNASRAKCRDKLWMPILSIGMSSLASGGRVTICTPWQPFKLAEIYVKAKQVSSVVSNLLKADLTSLNDADIYFENVRRNVALAYYPEICIWQDDQSPVLLSATESFADYVLLEPPVADRMGEDPESTDADVATVTKGFMNVVENYLELQPHEKSSFSVMIYNSDSKLLPSAIADSLVSLIEKDQNLRANLVLANDNPQRRYRMYEQQNALLGCDNQLILSSGSAKNFLSRLRVDFLEEKISHVQQQKSRSPIDLVLLLDVLSRNAQVHWTIAPDEHVGLLEHAPSSWSKRKPLSHGDNSLSTYLVCPVQPECLKYYHEAIYLAVEAIDPSEPSIKGHAPVRRINISNNTIGQMIDNAHSNGDWVVTIDRLADRRLFEEKGINIVRHVSSRNVDTGMVVSTSLDPKMLKVLLNSRIKKICPLISDERRVELANKFVCEAHKLSGGIVMRAARHARYTNELMGVVLSMEDIKSRLGVTEDKEMGWFCLDDYAGWFGQKEGQIADILAVSPKCCEGEKWLEIVISESKFVSEDGAASHAKKSASQLMQTITRVARSSGKVENNIDAEAWRERLANLMLDRMQAFDALGGEDLVSWSKGIRGGSIPIKIQGFSHVFVHDSDNDFQSRYDPLDGANVPCYQLKYGGLELKNLIQAVDNDESSPVIKIDEIFEPVTATKVLETDELNQVTITGDEVSSSTLDVGQQDILQSSEIENESSVSDESEAIEEPVGKTQETHIDGYSIPVSQWIGLDDFSAEDSSDLEWLSQMAISLRKALRSYEMTSEIVGSRLTPNAGLFRLRGSDNLTVIKVEKRANELLTSHAIDVIRVLPAPGEIIIMIRRPNRAVLVTKNIWRTRTLPKSSPKINTSLLLGIKEQDGEHLYLNVSDKFAGQSQHGPHTLIAGETGSGKGVLVQNLLLDICATNSPKSAHIRLIDPKAGVDFPWLRNMPHLQGDIVTDQESAAAMFEELVDEMEQRYRTFAQLGVAKLAQYNNRVDENDRLPVIWLFHDELADWMLLPEYRDVVEKNVVRLGVKARAAGIHLVMITQRPDKDALPIQLRANLSNRLVLKMADKRNSELVLDAPGAERLLGSGHLAAKLSGEPDIILAQVPFLDDEEIFSLSSAIIESNR